MTATHTVEIKHRWSGEVLFTAEVSADISEGLRVKAAVEMAVKAGANLDGANLARAYLYGANLYGANLDGANLDGANLDGANLDGANLDGANLYGANLDGANLDDKSILAGERPIFMLGPIGSESRTFVAYITKQGLRLRAGCFFGTREQFLEKLQATHADNIHAQEYKAALDLIDRHAELWTPADSKEEAA